MGPHTDALERTTVFATGVPPPRPRPKTFSASLPRASRRRDPACISCALLSTGRRTQTPLVSPFRRRAQWSLSPSSHQRRRREKSLPPVCFFSFFAVSRLLPPSNLHRFQGPRARLRVYSPVSTHGPRHHCETLAKENPKMLFPLVCILPFPGKAWRRRRRRQSEGTQ